MSESRTSRQRQATITEIKTVARQQMASQGQAALSLGAIARAMDVTTPALYRYFENRDALVTALIVDAYNALADALEATNARIAPTDYAARFRALATTYRAWAIANPHEYALIFGTPLPDYHAPREVTVPAASRLLIIFGQLFLEAAQAGQLVVPPAFTHLPAELQRTVATTIHDFTTDKSAPSGFLLMLTIRSQLHSLIWAELYGHLPPGIAEGGALYALQLNDIIERLGLGKHPNE